MVNARTAALNNSNSASEHIKGQIVQTLTEAGGQVDYVEVILEPFVLFNCQCLLTAIYAAIDRKSVV